MADSFHFQVSVVSRGKGKSAVASAAYISGEKIKNEYDGMTHDYTHKDKILKSEILLPDHVPQAFKERAYLWNQVELGEKAKNARLARQFIIQLPYELSLEENIKLVEDFIKTNLVNEGMLVDYAIHDESKEGNKNIHCHILATTRPIDDKGQWLAKSKKEYILDEKGEKVLGKNGKPKTRKVDLVNWNDIENMEKWRGSFSDLCNHYLKENGIEKQVDHRSYERQGLDILPTIHLGNVCSALERKGIATDRGDYNRAIKKHNAFVRSIKEQTRIFKNWISGFLNDLKTAFQEYQTESKEQAQTDSRLFNLREYLETYDEIQKVKMEQLPRYAQNKKLSHDLQKYIDVTYYLRHNNLQTIGDLQDKQEELRQRSFELNGKTKAINDKIVLLEKKITASKIYNETKPYFDKYKSSNLFTKESYFKEHKNEIERHEKAKVILKKLLGDSKTLEPSKWEKEKSQLMKQLDTVNEQKDEVKGEYKKLNQVKYIIEKVNQDLGINLSIEIDKLIKQGEKPSTIARLKQFQEQVQKDQRYKEQVKQRKQLKSKGEQVQ